MTKNHVNYLNMVVHLCLIYTKLMTILTILSKEHVNMSMENI